MAERVYKKKANVTTGVTLPAEGAPLPAAPQSNSLSVPTVGGQTTQRVYKKKATTPTLSGEVGQTTQRTYTVRPEVKAQKLQTWGESVSALSKDVTTYFDGINDGTVPTEDAYNQMIARIDQASAAAKQHRVSFADNAEVSAYVDDINGYLDKVRETVVRYRGGLEGVLRQEMEDRVVTATNSKNISAATNVQAPTLSIDNLTRMARVNDPDWAGKYNAANLQLANTKALAHDIFNGLSESGNLMSQGMDWLIPDDEIAKWLGVENQVGEFFDFVQHGVELNRAENARRDRYANPTIALVGNETLVPMVAALPNLAATIAAAIMSGGASVGVQLSAASGVISAWLSEMLKNPSFWLSFVQSGGAAYKNAVDSGATEAQAQTVAWLSAFPNAMIENIGGVEGIPKTEAGMWNAIKNIVSEGDEEVLQGMTEQWARMVVFEQEKQWFSFTDTDAVISTPRATQEFIGGVTVGAMLQGGFKATQYAYVSYQYSKLGSQFVNAETVVTDDGKKHSVTIDDAIAIGLNNAKGTDAYNAAVTIQQQVADGETISPYAVGRMVAESQTEQAQRSRAIEREVLESAAQVGYDTAAAETISMAAVALNQRVRFAAEGELGNSNNAGEYHRGTDTVLLNPALTDTDMLIGTIFAHEMTHTAEGTKQLATLAKIAQRMEGAKAWESRKAEIKAEYAATGQTLDPKAVESEALANWIGENLFNKRFAQAVADGDANVGNAFLFVIDRVRRALGAKKASAGNLAMLERLFMQALDNRTLGPREGDVQGSVNGAPVIDLSDHSELAKRVEGVYGAKKYTIIQNYILEVLGDQPVRLSDGKTAIVDKSDALHIANRAASKKTAEIAEIKQLVEKAVLYAEYADADHNKFNYFCYYKAEVKYNGDVFDVFLNVGRAKNDGQYHLYDITKNIRDTADRINGLERPKPNEGYALQNGVSDTNVAQNSTDVNTQSMQEGAGISAQDGGNGVQGALLPPEYRPGARAEGVDPNANVEGAEVTPSADGYTSSVAYGDTFPSRGRLGGVEGAAPYSADSGAVQVDEAVVLDTAIRSQLQGKKVVDVESPRLPDGQTPPFRQGGQSAADAAVDTIIEQLGEEEALRRMWNATQMDRPTGMVDIDGKRVDANAYMDAYEQSLPRDKAALERHIADLQEQRAAEVVKMEQEGTLEDYHFGGLKLDLQLFAATRLWDLLQLDEGETGKNARQFYEKRLRGTDANHNQELVDLLAGRSETYNPIATEKTLEKAKNKLRDSKYQEKLIKRIGKYNPRDLFSATDVAAAQVLINDAINDGELDVAADLITGLSRKGTELGRAVQSFSIMARLTPEGTLRAAIRTVKADADSAICEGANEGLDVLADDIARAIKEAAGNGLSSEEIADRIRRGVVGRDAPVQFDRVPQGLANQVQTAIGTDVTGYALVADAAAMTAIIDGGASVETLMDAEGRTLYIVTGGSADIDTTTDIIPQRKRIEAKLSREELVQLLSENLAAEQGNFLSQEEIYDLLWKTVDEATNIPEQVKRYVLKKIRKDDGGLAQRIYELHKRGDLKQVRLRRAMESALELPTLTDDDLTWLAQQGAKIESLQDKPVEQAAAMEELYDFLGAKLTVSGLDRLQSWRKFGMLFNVKTHLRNVFSNAAYYGIRKADDAVAMALERLFIRDRSKWGTALGWSHTEHGQSILPQLQEQAELAVLEMQKKGAKYEGTGNSVIKQKRKFFGLSKFGEMLNGLNRRNSEWLEREDVWFFKPAYIDALGQVMTARGVTEITPELHELAMQRALEATFRADNAISDVISSLKRFQNESATGKRLFGHGVDVVIPFHKTPANIATQIVMHSPVGIIKGAFDIHNATVGKGSKDVATAINTMAKGITGSALLAIGILLGTLGAFNAGFGKTEKERAADEMAGLQEGAFVVHGVSISLDWLQPAASPLVVGASIGERMKEEGISLSGVFGAVMDGTDSLFELTMLQSLYDILGGYDAGASGTLMSVGENVVSQSVPTLVGQVARSIDPTQRKTKGDNDFETILNQVAAKIPGLTYLLDPELDVWGNEVYRTGKAGTGSAVLNAAQQVVIPANTKVGTGIGDPISEEILRLYEEQGGAVIPTAITRDEAKDAGEDYVDVNKLLGGVNRLAVEALINNQVAYDLQVETGELTEKGNPKTKKVTKYYRDMTDDERRKVLSRIYSNTKDGVIGDASEKTEEQLTDSERYIRDLLRRVRNGEQGTSVAAEAAPEQQQEDTSYYDDLLRRMRNGN